MQIVCPTCTTSYELSPAAIGEKGRSVRCVRCQTVWFAAPPPLVQAPAPEPAMANAAADETVAAFSAELGAQAPAPTEHAGDPSPEPPHADQPGEKAAEPPTETAVATDEQPAAALSEIPIPVEDAPPLVPDAGAGSPSIDAETETGLPDVESVAARRARAAARKRRARWRIPLPLAIVALATVCVVLLGWRRDVVRHAPQLASFYDAIGLPVNLRGLAFTNVKIGNEIHDGVPVLVVEGMIVSTVSMAVDVPRLRFALRNPSGAEIYAWTAVPSQQILEPGQTLPFRSRLASPPAEGHDIQVRFFTRRDAVAGLR